MRCETLRRAGRESPYNSYRRRENPFGTNAIQRKPGSGASRPELTLFELDPITDPRWKVFAALHPRAAVFHRVEWLQALRNCYSYVPRVLSLTPPGGSSLLNGLVFCQIRSVLTGNRLVSVPFADHCEPLVESPEQFDLLMKGLTAKVDSNRWSYAEVRPVFHQPISQTEYATPTSYFLHRLDLRSSEDLLFKSFHKDSVQRKIRRAEREQLRYEEGHSESLLDHFYRLVVMTRKRQALPPQPRKWFQSLIKFLGSNLKIRVAFKGQIPVASILTICDHKTMVYKYGCSDARFNNLGGTAMLFWKTIQEAKANGLEELDMGRADVDNAGLITFKERWGAKRTTMNYWRYPNRGRVSLPTRCPKRLRRLISLLPDGCLVALGSVLYRHIG
jgi:CelD/BcsL family acetyltransferase involved in cellulose biosynthesis